MTTDALAGVLSDASLGQAMLDVEAALGKLQLAGVAQDVSDTGMVLVLRRARPILAGYQQGLTDGLRALADSNTGDFGLKAAGWYAAVRASWRRFDARFDEALLLQFGGAPSAGDALAAELGLPNPPAPWYKRRDRIAAIVCAGAIYVGVLGRLARDIGSPLAAAAHMPGVAASFLTAMADEHTQEWPIVADAIQTIGVAISTMSRVVGELHVDESSAADPQDLAEQFRRRLLEE